MKAASAATLAILAGGKAFKVDLFSITLVTGAVTYVTSADLSLKAAIYPSGTSNTYLTGWTIKRGSTTQEVGLDSQEMDLTIAPQWDAPGGPPLVGGYSLMQAARVGLLDNAQIIYSKLFMNLPVIGAQPDTSPGAVAWFQGIAAEIDIQRLYVDIKVSSDLITLNQVQMPRNLYQAICPHTLYDSGCTLSKAAFTSTGAVSSVVSTSSFNTGLTQADGYFNLGVVKFTSGQNSGFSSTIKQYLHASGNIQVVIPFPKPITTSDAFSVYPGDDRLQATCAAKFSNLAHFKGTPYIPVSETLYDGGTSSPTAGSGQLPGGSGPGGRILPPK